MEKKCSFYSHFYKVRAFKLKLLKQNGNTVQAMNKSTTTAFFGA